MSTVTSPTLAPEAEALRLEGNKFVGEEKYMKAIASYTAAIDMGTPTAALYLNRALCYLKVSYSGEALSDADEAQKIDPNNPKVHYRRGSALAQLGKLKEALAAFRIAAAMVPNDPDAQAKVQMCDKMLRRAQFEAAIAGDDPATPSQRVKVADLVVPSDYTGPRIGDDEVITEEYVLAAMEHFRQEKLIARRDVIIIFMQALKALKASPNVVAVDFPEDEHITVCGDTHGQYYDTLNIFKLAGTPSKKNRYVFNGDFVDRGSYSLENVTLLLAFKALYPDHFFLSRGNHESVMLNRMYGFEGEVKAKYDDFVFDLLQEVFRALPLAHILNRKVFVTHGGLFSRDGVTIGDLQKIDRIRDIPDEGLMCECLWSDPMPSTGRARSKRGAGLDFGPDVTANFLETNNLELVVRSHEVNDEGYVVLHGGKLITVFSAPNYCDQIGNKGAYLRFEGKDMKPQPTQFAHVPHPGKRPMAYAPKGLLGL
jgi:serine/threonine-protein phosphatase 5